MMVTAMEPIPTIRTIIKPITIRATTMMGTYITLQRLVFRASLILAISGYYTADGQAPYQQDAYYDGNQGYQDEYYDGQYYDQGDPAQQAQYNQAGYGYVKESTT